MSKKDLQALRLWRQNSIEVSKFNQNSIVEKN